MATSLDQFASSVNLRSAITNKARKLCEKRLDIVNRHRVNVVIFPQLVLLLSTLDRAAPSLSIPPFFDFYVPELALNCHFLMLDFKFSRHAVIHLIANLVVAKPHKIKYPA